MRQHDWRELRVTPVEMIEGVAVAIPGLEPEVTYGCFICQMGYEEGMANECPGQDLFEEGEKDWDGYDDGPITEEGSANDDIDGCQPSD